MSYNFREIAGKKGHMGVDHQEAYLSNVYKYADTE